LRRAAEMNSFGGSNARRWLYPLAAFLVPLCLFPIGWRFLGGDGDTEPAQLLPISLLRESDFDFDEFVNPSGALPYWFRRAEGRVISAYPVLPGLLNLPVYFLADLLGVNLMGERERLSMLSSSTISAGSVLFLFLCLRRICANWDRALGLAFVYAFGTAVWSVTSRGMLQHGPSLLFLSASLWLLWNDRDWAIALSGLLLAFAVVGRPTNVLLALPLAVFALWRRPRVFPAFLALAAIPLGLHVLYCWSYWGTPLSFGQRDPFPEVANFSGNPFIGLAGLLFSPSRGLFVFSPIFFFSVPGAVIAIGRRKEQPIYPYLVIGVVLLLLVYSKWTVWWGGHTFGYRLIIEILPALTIFLALAWEAALRQKVGLRVAFAIALVLSVYIHFLGATVHPSGFNERMEENRARLWSIRESELVLSTKKLFGQAPR